MRVTISIVTYNHAKTIGLALESVFRQTFQPLEIIVVDNASSDETLNVLAQYQNRIKLIPNECNTGFCGGQNKAIGHSTGDYVLVMNPDIILDPNYIANAVEMMNRNRNAGTLAGLLLTHAPNGQTVIDSTGVGFKKNRRFFIYNYNVSADTSPLHPATVFGCDGALALYRRTMIDAVRMNHEFFDEMYFAYKDAFDLSWRAQLAGWSTLFAPECRAFHDHKFKPGDLKLRARMPESFRFHSVKNDLLHLLKNENLKSLLMDAPFIFFRQLRIFIYVCFFEAKSLKAYGWTIKNIKPILARRKKFAQHWKTSPYVIRKQFADRTWAHIQTQTTRPLC